MTTGDAATSDGSSVDAVTATDSGGSEGGSDAAPMLDKSDLAFWYVASMSNVVMMGSNVAKWADSSMKGNDLTAGPIAPKFAANGVGSGKDAIQFSEDSPMVFKADPFIAFQSGYTLFVTISSTAQFDGFWLWGAADAAGTMNRLGIGPFFPDSGGSWCMHVLPGTATSPGHETAKLKVYSVVGEGGNTQLYVDGMTTGSSPLPMPAAMPRMYSFVGGHLESGKAREGAPGYYAEIIGYSRALSPGQHKAVIDYLHAKWK